MQVNKKLLFSSVPLGNTNSDFTYDRLVGILNYLVENALLLGGLIAVGAIVYYGMRMSMARSEPKNYLEAKESLIKAVIGAALIFGVYTVINTVQGLAGTLTN